ncbi:MAG: F0F1 ATP synthase subunit B [Clostridium sp.]|jgi:F-type H+-transporting ATPase subunit b|nr:F0F1 ATP synthase subunit B [Clostridium sp.]
MERIFDLDWQLIADAALMVIAVFVLFLFMSYFLFNPVRKLLENRRNKIQEELDSAKKNMESAKALREEYEDRLRGVDQESEGILSDARKRALSNENQIVAQAKQEAARILERARVEAQLEKQKVADEMKREMISVASLMAGKMVTASMDGSVQERLIDETLREMGESTWLN